MTDEEEREIIGDLVGHPGWGMLCNEIDKQAQTVAQSLLALPPSMLASDGAELSGRYRGLRDALRCLYHKGGIPLPEKFRA